MARILVVDDNAIDRSIAGDLVVEHGSTPLFAENGRVALEVIHEQSPDIVLTDLQMPEIDGLELVSRMRAEFPDVPVVLMTAYGSEEIAVNALRAGAASYVPKTNLKAELREALRSVLRAVEAKHHRDKVRRFLQSSHSEFELGCEEEGTAALVSFLQDGLQQLNFCDAAGLFQVTTALVEALANAVDHGSLELDSALRETDDYDYGKLRIQRMSESPYRDRRVFVSVHLTPAKATYVVRDQGGGFDPSSLPDPTDPDNLLKASGRGIMLIRTFMDEVSFNDIGNEITMVKRAE